MKKLLIIVEYTVLILLFIFVIFSVFGVSFLGFQFFKVGSGSMEPTLQVGDIILVQRQENYSTDDIITYKSNGEYITHRIIEIDGDTVVTKGDANNTEDEEINKEQIIGKYVVFISKVVSMLVDPIIFILLISIIFIINMIGSKKTKRKPKH